MSAIPLTDPAGTVRAWACDTCQHGFNDRERAEQCCLCFECHTAPSSGGRRCPACQRAFDARWEDGKAERARVRAEENARGDATFALSKDPAAARELGEAMSEISEEYYCAGWLIGLEFSLWEMIAGGPRRFGMGDVTDAEIANLRRLADAAGGWCVWRDDHGGESFAPLAEWAEMVRAERAKVSP